MNIEQRAETVSKYTTVLNIITSMENRLLWSELLYLFLNIIIIFAASGLSVYSDSVAVGEIAHPMKSKYIVMVLFVIGEFVCLYWVISSMRIQLKLKLRYFQARTIERKLDMPGEAMISDESVFFNPTIGYVESFDKQEKVVYPREGAVRMDGFAGSAKPRHLTWVLPALFFFIYILFFIGSIIKILSSM